VIQPDRVLRLLNERGASVLDAFLKSEIIQTLGGSIVETRPAGALAVEHPKVWFPSYPYEWPAEMLHAAGELTLDLATSALSEGWGLKDATPYNVLFEGPRPIFVGICSFEQRDPGDSVWLAYGQFVRTFLNPLIAHRYLRFPVEALMLTSRDGIDSEHLCIWTPWLYRWFSPLMLATVTVPAMLGRRAAGRRIKSDPKRVLKIRDNDEASWVLKRVPSSLGRKLKAARPTGRSESRWTRYMQTFTYSPQQFRFKSKFVEEC
jgi:hypothetical protein